MSLRERMQGAMPVTAPLVLNPLMARMVGGGGFRGRVSGRRGHGYQKVALEANLNVTEMCQAAIEIRRGVVAAADPRRRVRLRRPDAHAPHHRHGEAAGFAAIEIEDQLVPKRAHHHIGIEHMIPMELMVAKVREAVAARRSPDFLIVGAHQRHARQHHGRRAPPRRGLSQGRRRPRAAVDGQQAGAAARRSPSASADRSCTWPAAAGWPVSA